MRVYRLERQNSDGEFMGVFCTSGTLNYPSDANYANFGCGIENAHWNDDYRFACDSIEKLIEYFGSDFAVQLNEGAIIVEYNVHMAHTKYSMHEDKDGETIYEIETAFLASKVKERIVILEGEKQCKKQLETSPSTGKIGRVRKTSVMESLDSGLTFSSSWRVPQTLVEDYQKNLRRMELYNDWRFETSKRPDFVTQVRGA